MSKYQIRLDENQYIDLISINLNQDNEDFIENSGNIFLDSLDDYDFSGERAYAYYWDGEKFIFDEDKFTNITTQVSISDLQRQVMNLKDQLAATDYVVIKIMEGSAEVSDYADVITQRRQWRKEIDILEEQITQLKENEK